MFTAILLILIVSYACLVIYRKVKEFKSGRYCSGCSCGCASKSCETCHAVTNRNSK